MTDYHIPLFPDTSYHILSRAVGDEKLFRKPADYQVFLSRYQNHISPIANTYGYCLLPNHFHFLIHTKDEACIEQQFEKIKKNKEYFPAFAPTFIMERFSNFLNSYAKTFNNTYSRKGALFIDYMRRVEVTTQPQLTNTLFYIHRNPIHHHYCQSLQEWQWSSYKEIPATCPSFLLQKEVLGWFDGKQGYFDFHAQKMQEYYTSIY